MVALGPGKRVGELVVHHIAAVVSGNAKAQDVADPHDPVGLYIRRGKRHTRRGAAKSRPIGWTGNLRRTIEDIPRDGHVYGIDQRRRETMRIVEGDIMS